MEVTYSKTSPYFQTKTFGNYLDIANFPAIPKLPDDTTVTINQTYQFRPDLLAYDLYGDASLWWVFALRNPNTITDPVFSMRSGITIYIPKKATLTGIIGAF